MITELDVTPEARPYLVRGAGQYVRIPVPFSIPASPDGDLSVPGNPATFIELTVEISSTGGLLVRPWIDGVPADTRELAEL